MNGILILAMVSLSYILAAAAASFGTTANGLSAMPTFRETRQLFKQAALGEPGATEHCIQVLQAMWDEAPLYEMKRQDKVLEWLQNIRNEEWRTFRGTDDDAREQVSAPLPGENEEFDKLMYREHGYDPDQDLQRRIIGLRLSVAKRLLRFHLEDGDLSAASKINENLMVLQEQNGRNPGKDLVQADLHFAMGNYEEAIDLYQENIEIVTADEFERKKYPFKDDVLLSKMGLASYRMGYVDRARCYFGLAAELQELNGLLLESLVTACRINNLCDGDQPDEMCDSLPDSFGDFYPTIKEIVCQKKVGNVDGASDDLACAFAAFVDGNYANTRKLLGKDTTGRRSPERRALLALLLRERHLDDLANMFQFDGKKETDPFAALKRMILATKDRDPIFFLESSIHDEAEEELDAYEALFAGPSLLHSSGVEEDPMRNTAVAYQDSVAVMEKVVERLDSSSLCAAAYLQIAKHLERLANTNNLERERTRDEVIDVLLEKDEQDFLRQQRQRDTCLVMLQKALQEPGISPLVRINAEIDFFLVKREMSEAKTPERNENGVIVIIIDGSDDPTERSDGSSFRTSETKALALAKEELQKLGLTESLTALEVARRMKRSDGTGASQERALLAALFGNSSKAVLDTREEEAREDLNYGSGARAEELLTQLLLENHHSLSEFWMEQLAWAKKKQGKYSEAMEVYEELKQTEVFQTRQDMRSHYLLEIAELHKLNGDLDTAATVYREVTALQGETKWDDARRQYGYIGLGMIALENGNLEDAREEFKKAVDVVQTALDNAFSTNFADNSEWSDHEDMVKHNVIAGAGNCLYDISEAYLEHGLPLEAMAYLEQCLQVVNNEWFMSRDNMKKGVLSKMEKIRVNLDSNETTRADLK